MDQINETGTNNTDKSKNMDKIHESGKKYTFEDLREIMRTLRSENGCPWDRRQTHESLIPCLEEEAGEVIDAIRNQDPENLCEELGDLLFQVMSHIRNLVTLSGPVMADQVLETGEELTDIVTYPNEDFIATTLTPVRDSRGEIRYLIYSVTNCSESIRMQSELNQLNARNLALESQLNELLTTSL